MFILTNNKIYDMHIVLFKYKKSKQKIFAYYIPSLEIYYLICPYYLFLNKIRYTSLYYRYIQA